MTSQPPPDPYGEQPRPDPYGPSSPPPPASQPQHPGGGYPPPGYQQPGYEQGYQQPGYEQGYQQPGYEQGYQQPGYPPPGYQPPPGYPPPPPAPGTNVMAILALVFAFIFAPVAIVLGHIAKKQIAERGEEGSGLATAGLVLGYIFTGLAVLGCCAVIGLGIAADSST